jgi:hypothetical protein
MFGCSGKKGGRKVFEKAPKGVGLYSLWGRLRRKGPHGLLTEMEMWKQMHLLRNAWHLG